MCIRDKETERREKKATEIKRPAVIFWIGLP